VRAHLTPTALAKAKALGIVAAALSAGGAGGVVALSQVANTADTAVTVAADATPTPTDSPTDSPTASPTASPSDSPTATDAAAAATPTSTAYVLPSCPADVKNHGAYVSSVAKSAPKGAGGEHGSWVRQAAQSDCGKPTPGASESPDPQETDSPESHSPKPVKTTSHHAATHKQHGHGHSGG